MNLAINVTLVGIFVVFSALVLLSALISFSNKIFAYKKNNKGNDVNSLRDNKIEQIDTNDNLNPETNEENDGELIAVLTAAVMAHMKQTSDTKIKIRSYKRVTRSSSPWNSVGTVEQISSRF
jgi:sodium pump decarboxylase gamma subunit